ncbi:hypothetical protein PB01_13360 [Psychrobacillus glaciei]|uniref:Uncharacterized protein n=1 Tax=Psychrobacillus glaciei TaxID=2283160 RepID=A0A5J6SP64_9BACI|nr:hypothetical protein PB01_13360 [Psychrobacillus glaciei]
MVFAFHGRGLSLLAALWGLQLTLFPQESHAPARARRKKEVAPARARRRKEVAPARARRRKEVAPALARRKCNLPPR